MAEEMAETNASNTSKHTDRSTDRNNSSTRKSKTVSAPRSEAVAPSPEKGSPQTEAQDSRQSNTHENEPKLSFREMLEKEVAERFPKIIEGLMKGIKQGKPGGAKVLFDAIVKLRSEPEKAEQALESGVRISDLLGPGWRDLMEAEDPAASEPTEDGIDVGIGVREPE